MGGGVGPFWNVDAFTVALNRVDERLTPFIEAAAIANPKPQLAALLIANP